VSAISRLKDFRIKLSSSSLECQTVKYTAVFQENTKKKTALFNAVLQVYKRHAFRWQIQKPCRCGATIDRFVVCLRA
jgi:hypothetical protein